MTTKNPFPGMNPYLERSWSDVHTRLIGYISDALADDLPSDLRARAEEGVVLSTAGSYRADIAVKEHWELGESPVWSPSEDLGTAVVVAEPEIVDLAPPTERWVEIRQQSGELVTVIEVLSLANKTGNGAVDYQKKQRAYLESGVNLVEIDLLRGGRYVLPVPVESLKLYEGTRYLIAVSRACTPHRHEMYSCPLRERLPAIRIPLRPSDRDAPLDLQPLIDRCYEKGRYWQTDYAEPIRPRMDEDDQVWVEAQLKERLARARS